MAGQMIRHALYCGCARLADELPNAGFARFGGYRRGFRWESLIIFEGMSTF